MPHQGQVGKYEASVKSIVLFQRKTPAALPTLVLSHFESCCVAEEEDCSTSDGGDVIFGLVFKLTQTPIITETEKWRE